MEETAAFCSPPTPLFKEPKPEDNPKLGFEDPTNPVFVPNPLPLNKPVDEVPVLEKSPVGFAVEFPNSEFPPRLVPPSVDVLEFCPNENPLVCGLLNPPLNKPPLVPDVLVPNGLVPNALGVVLVTPKPVPAGFAPNNDVPPLVLLFVPNVKLEVVCDGALKPPNLFCCEPNSPIP